MVPPRLYLCVLSAWQACIGVAVAIIKVLDIEDQHIHRSFSREFAATLVVHIPLRPMAVCINRHELTFRGSGGSCGQA